MTFADKVWISNKVTSEPPFSTYIDKDGNRLIYQDGGYVLVETLIQNEDWNLLLDAPALTDGRDGESLQVRYSSDKSNWNSTYTHGDVWMQQRVGDNSVWSDSIRIAGEKGAAGADGTYYDYQFAINGSLDVAPATGWQDTPPTVGLGQFLWMRTRLVDPKSSEENPWRTARIGGEKGEKGDSMSNMGKWKSSMAVPYLGVVMMSSTSYVSRNATSNPPLWCWTDKDGNRLIFNDDGYILTGEANITEYDVLAEKGDKGDKGAQGLQGIQGCIIRDSEWVLGTQYRNDEALLSGTRYIDVVLVRNDTATTGWDAYKCKVTHTSSASTAPGNTTYWESFGTNVASIFTSLIVAKNAKIRFLQGNELLIQKSNGQITAGMSGSESGKKVRFWAGSETPDDAPFSVTEEGIATSTKFRTGRSGLRLEAENGLISVFGNITKNIEFGVNEEGLAVMKYYDNNGTLLYDLGPEGIKTVERAQDIWSTIRLTFVGISLIDVFDTYWGKVMNPLKDTGVDRYQYHSGYVGGAYTDKENDRRFFTEKSVSSDKYLADGWYTRTFLSDPTKFERLMYMPLDGETPPDMNSSNPPLDSSKPIYITVVTHIRSGKITESLNAYYNL